MQVYSWNGTIFRVRWATAFKSVSRLYIPCYALGAVIRPRDCKFRQGLVEYRVLCLLRTIWDLRVVCVWEWSWSWSWRKTSCQVEHKCYVMSKGRTRDPSQPSNSGQYGPLTCVVAFGGGGVRELSWHSLFLTKHGRAGSVFTCLYQRQSASSERIVHLTW